MKIAAIRLFNVKRFAGRGVAIEDIGDGVNVLCAVNEFGKSTSFEALHALFFQAHSSTAGDVRNLRPYSGGNPLVEADIVTDAARFRITKQFYGGRSARVVDLSSGRLVAQADEAENFIAQLVRGGTAGPAGLLWVRQGLTGMEKRSRAEEDGERGIRAGLLESVQGEVEAVTGGRRMAEIMAAAEAALGRLVTATGRPRAGEAYAAAIEERDRLEVEERRLAGEVATLRDALDRRAAAMKRIAELDDADQRNDRRRAIDEAQARYDAARTQAQAVRAAEAELRFAREQRDAAVKDLDAYRTALKRAAALEPRRSEVERQRAEAFARRDAAADAAARARTDYDAAEREEQETRALLTRLESSLKARERAGRLVDLEKRLDAAEAARQTIEDGEARLVAVRIPDKTVGELEALELEIAKLKAVAEAARPSVTVFYAEHAPPISLDGVVLADGRPQSYDGQAEIEVPGVGRLTLRSNLASGDDGRLERSAERRRALLASLGVPDLATARSRQSDARTTESDLREMRARLSLLAPDGIAELRAQVARERAEASQEIELKEDPVQVRLALAVAETRRGTARDALRASEPLHASATDAIVAAQTALAGIEAERAQLESVLGPDAGRAERERDLVAAVEVREATLAEKQAITARLDAEAVDLAAAQATLARARSVADGIELELGRLREEIAGLTAGIRARSDDAVEETWRETADALATARTRAADYEREVAVLQRLRSALDAARTRARETYLQPVMNELRPLLRLLFDDVSISFDDRTLLPHRILRNGQEEDVERLSGGMREQLSVLTRLAFARLLARDGRPAPVILDDALVYSDDDRIERMFDALHRQSQDQQIIVFSCRQRAFQKLGGRILHVVDWTPGP